MCEWPMGIYGRALADYINGKELSRGRILELGAGVGHASRFIHAASAAVYIKTDINEAILRMYNRGGILKAFDIDWSKLRPTISTSFLHQMCCTVRKTGAER